jgi:predicted metal-dependent hydrolase
MPRSTTNFDTVRKIGLALPGVEESTAYGSLKVHGKLLACAPAHRSAEPGSLVVRVDFDDRAELLAADPAISKLGWIKHQQRKLQAQERETPREYLDRESHYVWGRRYLLKVEEAAAPEIELKHSRMILHVGPGTNRDAKQAIVARWYRDQIKAAVPDLVAMWEPPLGVKVERVFVQKMKTKWGSCNPSRRSIRLNTELAKKPHKCLKYIVLHEMVHLIERHHNDRFRKYMDRLLPQWHLYQSELNSAPLAHEKWGY